MASPAAMASPVHSIQYPERFELAKKFGEEGGLESMDVTDSDHLLLYALGQQATHGACDEPRPSPPLRRC